MQLSSSRVDHCILHIPQVASCKSRNWSPFQRSKRAFWSCRHTLGRNMCNQRQQGWEHIVVPRWKWVQYGRLRSSQYFAPSLFNCVSFISFSLSLLFFSPSLSLSPFYVWDAKTQLLWILIDWTFDGSIQYRVEQQRSMNQTPCAILYNITMPCGIHAMVWEYGQYVPT